MNDAQADAADASADGPALSVPQALDQQGKLALWLEASSANIMLGDGGVTSWKDSSQNHNDAIAGVNEPSVLASVVAGHDAVAFDPSVPTSPLGIADAASLRFGTDQVYITVVTRAKSLRGTWYAKTILDDAGSQDGISFFVASGDGPSDAGPIFAPYVSVNGFPGNAEKWTLATLNDEQFHIVAFLRPNPTSLELTVDDLPAQTQSSVTPMDVTALGAPALVGEMLQSPGNVAIAEELVVHDTSGVVSAADIASVHAYLKQKYGL
jgi:hypothetical protein